MSAYGRFNNHGNSNRLVHIYNTILVLRNQSSSNLNFSRKIDLLFFLRHGQGGQGTGGQGGGGGGGGGQGVGHGAGQHMIC